MAKKPADRPSSARVVVRSLRDAARVLALLVLTFFLLVLLQAAHRAGRRADVGAPFDLVAAGNAAAQSALNDILQKHGDDEAWLLWMTAQLTALEAPGSELEDFYMRMVRQS